MVYPNNFPLDTKINVEKKTVSSSLLFNLEIPDLMDIQRNSFNSFIEYGFTNVFEKNNPLLFSNATQQIQIHFFPKWLQFRKPEYSVHQAIRLGKTYGSSIYVPVILKSNNSETFEVEWLLLGFLPLMVKQGHFIINGIPRVVLHQITRNPGLYIIPKDSRTRVPTIRIVPDQGSWINLTLDKKNRVWFTTRILRRKISLLIILQAFGFSFTTTGEQLDHADLLSNSFVKSLQSSEKTRHDSILIRAGLTGHPTSQEDAWRYIYAHFQEYTAQTRDEPVTTETARAFFWKTFWNSKNTYLGEIGRQQFQKKINSPISTSYYFLTGEDILAATQGLLKLVYTEKMPDDIDSLTNKRVRGCGEFLEDELGRGLKDFEITLTRKINNTSQKEIEPLWRLNKSLLAKSVSKSWKSFFTSGTLSQFMDETNPLAEVTHKRRITVLGPGGVSGKQTTIQIRGIHPTFYGRLCPIETPEGQNAGLVSSFSLFTKHTKNGNLKTPFFQVYKGQIQGNLPPFSFSPEQEYKHVIAPADIQVTSLHLLPKQSLPVRKEWKFDYDLSSQITTQSVGVLQIISVATSLIPFLEHDDANRALMGSNMQRQSVPLLKPQKPLVGTGLETRVLADVNHLLQASKSGYITSVTSKKIKTVKPNSLALRSSIFFSFFQSQKRSQLNEILAKKKYIAVSAEKNALLGSFRGQSISVKFLGTQKNTYFSSTKKGLPQTLQKDKTSYAFFSRKLIQEKLITDLNLKKEFFPTKRPMITRELDLPNLDENYLLNLYRRTNQSTTNLHRPALDEGNWVEKGDILADGAASACGKLSLGQNILVAYLPWEGYNFEDAILISERLVQQDIFTSLHLDYYEIEVKNTQYGLERITNQIPMKIDESSHESSRIQNLNQNGLIEIGTWVGEGDYLVGKVSPTSPKGPSVQHQYEKLYNVIMQRENTSFRNTSLRVPKGVEGFVLDVQHLPPKEADVLALAEKNALLRIRVVLLQRRKIQVGDKMAGRHGNKGIVSKILPRHDMPYLPDGTPIDIVLNPLGVPSRMNVGQILECLLGLAGHYLNESYTTNLFDEKFGAEASRSLVFGKLYEASVKTGNSWLFEPHHPGKIKVFDGRTGVPFDQPITIGVAYILKLVHLVDDKIHARATGPYSAVTQQPVRGRSRNGGQRLGEMEVWALQAYGAAYTLQELLTIKSDDVDGRKEAVFRIYTNKPLKFGPPESFKVLLRELQALCFDLQIDGLIDKKKEPQQLNLTKLEKLI